MTYLKAGRTVRFEMSRGTLSRLEISESGSAEETNGRFSCRPQLSDLLTAAPDQSHVDQAADALGRLPGVERFTLLSGTASHRVFEVEWSETFGRLLVSLVNYRASVRVVLDLGSATFDHHKYVARVERVAEALQRVETRRDLKGPVLLRPAISAELWPVVIAQTPVEQSTHPEFTRDGDGKIIAPRVLAAGSEWPNRFRPSYRARPVPMPFHLRAPARGPRPSAELHAVAVAEPPHIINGYIVAALLCEPSSGEPFVGRLEIALRELNTRILAVSDGVEWFPYAAGSYGSDVLIDG